MGVLLLSLGDYSTAYETSQSWTAPLFNLSQCPQWIPLFAMLNYSSSSYFRCITFPLSCHLAIFYSSSSPPPPTSTPLNIFTAPLWTTFKLWVSFGYWAVQWRSGGVTPEPSRKAFSIFLFSHVMHLYMCPILYWPHRLPCKTANWSIVCCLWSPASLCQRHCFLEFSLSLTVCVSD